ncbi:LacI family DNA-binding transcriptional regulator [Luteimonas fraxinea]|uniref:LacI family DNA-binding transcriptional regulator n=1 Tax=Luteimonas fraxinea TaxID=2901869 RepID=A0ABS8UH95_9GAMM|nr:LacI family DNA-binding transcriptional regulator [Luteimonas fraxinea]MCD9098888.1 LacI family DNA-binding transcriptional regulator [Luteimonas fraxinea]MCD9125248.1 LacI family DNA-binding transcriptional regulator [Luteimonas fraxinea]UHH09057.1 LacI family DNA-binding transcriptional regulator [Luteimonas fraxinea]
MPAAKKTTKAAAVRDPSRPATINDIARLAGVSKKTVSRIINHSPLVRQDTREKVETLMREVGYSPDPLARGLAFRRSFLIGMVYDNPTAQFIVNMQYGALDSLRGSGYELVVHPCDSRSPDYVDGVRRFVQQQKLHGVMLVPRVSEDPALAAMLDSIGVRYVRIAAVSMDKPERMVVTHDHDGAAEVADYLQSLGHRDIALITGPRDYRSSIERTGGFLSALQKRGIDLPKSRVVEAGYTFESGVAAAEKLLSAKKRPTAIFCGNDEMAAGVYRVAMRDGINVPRDLSVVGYDDSPLATRLWPPLTSVRRDTRDTGRIAAAMLIQPEDGPRPLASVRPHLILRDSCQPPK